MKKTLSIILSVILIFGSLIFSENIFAATNDILEFPCGLDTVAVFNRKSGTLTVKGTGELRFFHAANPPWWVYRNEITNVIVEEGITYLDSVAFLDCDIVKIELPSTLEQIGADAFSMNPIEEIFIPENNRLINFPVSSYFMDSPWYRNQPDGPVYIGDLLIHYKGTMPPNTTVTVREGTYAINDYAFYNQPNLVNLIVPDSVERVGYRAFYNTGWFNQFPDYQIVYVGNVLYNYKTPWKDTATVLDECVIPEGPVSISPSAFDGRFKYKTVVIPDSFEHIGMQAFDGCSEIEKILISENSSLNYIDCIAFAGCSKLKEFYFPEGLEYIGINAFSLCKELKTVELPSTVSNIGLTAFDPSSLDSFTVDENNPWYCSDEDGILYSKDKTVVYASYQTTEKETLILPDTLREIAPQAFVVSPVKNFVLPDSVNEIGFDAFSESQIASINIPYGVRRINEYTFYKCNNLKEAEIPKSVEFIGIGAFESNYGISKVVIPEEVKYIAGDVFESCPNCVIYCYKDTPAYYFATENFISYVVLERPDMSRLDALLKEYNELDRDKYIEGSLSALDDAVSKVDMTITVITQEMVDGWIAEIENAEKQLVYVSADYSSVEEAKKIASQIDRTFYTEESLAALDEALAAVDEALDVSQQENVDKYAKAIEEAIKNLDYLPADYTKVNEAISESEKLDRIIYSQSTLTALDQSISAVDYTLNITQQSIVDGFAQRIVSSIAALEYADVVLRDEPNGVVVSATAMEIYPSTALTVDMLDPSNYETANFAVGGHIKSVQYYDINLIRDGVKVQPEGTVFVKIRIPDGVTPEKCRVYHVTEDPVDPLVRFASTLDGNYIVFETDHFSEFAVIEVETYLSGVSVTKLPSKLAYAINQKLDLTDMEVTALFSDGKSQVITDYDVSTVDTSSIGKKTVTVYYTFGEVTKSASFEITVSADKFVAEITSEGKSINEYNKKVVWYKGYSSESLKLECNIPDSEKYSIKWNSDNSKVIVDENGKVTNKGFFFPRKATITVTVTDSAGNVIATDSVVIRFYKFNFQLSGIQNVFSTLRRNGILYF